MGWIMAQNGPKMGWIMTQNGPKMGWIIAQNGPKMGWIMAQNNVGYHPHGERKKEWREGRVVEGIGWVGWMLLIGMAVGVIEMDNFDH